MPKKSINGVTVEDVLTNRLESMTKIPRSGRIDQSVLNRLGEHLFAYASIICDCINPAQAKRILDAFTEATRIVLPSSLPDHSYSQIFDSATRKLQGIIS